MKFVKYLGLGLLFGMVMTKSEAVSWYRIQEMFLFDNFHMYGIIGTAVVLGIITTALIKALNLQTFKGEEIKFHPKNMSIPRYLIGGIIFGLGWSMTGACPGPMYTLLGQGYWAVLIIIASALVGTYLYGALRAKLPH